jgi:O-antigen ligase
MSTPPDQPPHAGPSLAWWLPPRGDRAARAAFWFRYHVDRFGDPVHLALACLFCAVATGPISIAESAAFAVTVCWLIRLPFIWRSQLLVCRQWNALLLSALFLWQTVLLLAAPDPGAGIEQWGACRYVPLIFVLYPVARHRGWLMLAAAAGLAINACLQVIEAVAPGLIPIPELAQRWPDGRIGGWSSPLMAGQLLVGALAIHAAAMLHGRSRGVVLAAFAGGMLSIAGIALSGTRGAWIASFVLVVVVAIVALRTRLRSARSRRLVIVGMASLLALAAILILASDAGRRRLLDARNEVVRLVEQGESQTSIGLRARMVQWGIQAASERPLTGIGPGQFRGWVLAAKAGASGDELGAIERFEREHHDHCHNTPLSMLMAAGVPGLMLLAAVTLVAMVVGFRRGDADADGPDLIKAYAAGPAWLLLAMTLLWPFESFFVMVQPTMVMMIAVALCPGWLASMPGDRPSRTPVP